MLHRNDPVSNWEKNFLDLLTAHTWPTGGLWTADLVAIAPRGRPLVAIIRAQPVGAPDHGPGGVNNDQHRSLVK